MTRRLISSGSSWEQEVCYSRAVVSGDWVFVSGCTGYDYNTNTVSPGIEAQTEQTFVNIDEALKAAGAAMKDVVRVRYLLVDRREFPRCWETIRRWFGDVRPAATMLVVAGLHTEEMRIEIEVTARMGGGNVEGKGKSEGNPL